MCRAEVLTDRVKQRFFLEKTERRVKGYLGSFNSVLCNSFVMRKINFEPNWVKVISKDGKVNSIFLCGVASLTDLNLIFCRRFTRWSNISIYAEMLPIILFPEQFTVGVLDATLDLAALVLVGVVAFLCSEVSCLPLSPIVSGCLLHVGGGCWLVWPHLEQKYSEIKITGFNLNLLTVNCLGSTLV